MSWAAVFYPTIFLVVTVFILFWENLSVYLVILVACKKSIFQKLSNTSKYMNSTLDMGWSFNETYLSRQYSPTKLTHIHTNTCLLIASELSVHVSLDFHRLLIVRDLFVMCPSCGCWLHLFAMVCDLSARVSFHYHCVFRCLLIVVVC